MSEVGISFIKMKGGGNGLSQDEEYWQREKSHQWILSYLYVFLKISGFNVYALEKIIPRYYDLLYFVIYSKVVLTLKVPLNFSIKLENDFPN